MLGGLIVHAQTDDMLDEIISRARQPELPLGEMKWVKVSRGKFAAYRRVVDSFFDNAQKCPPLILHTLAIDTHQLNDRAFNQGSREIGFNKEIYQLCMKFGRLNPDRLFHVYPDWRSSPSPAEELRLILNRGMRRVDNRDWPFRRIHFRRSRECQALQLVDMLIGGLAFHLNGHRGIDGASPAKCALSDHILTRAGIRDVFRDTRNDAQITIWHRRLKRVL